MYIDTLVWKLSKKDALVCAHNASYQTEYKVYVRVCLLQLTADEPECLV